LKILGPEDSHLIQRSPQICIPFVFFFEAVPPTFLMAITCSNKNLRKSLVSWFLIKIPSFFLKKSKIGSRNPWRCLGESGQAHFAVPLEVGAAPGSAEAGYETLGHSF